MSPMFTMIPSKSGSPPGSPHRSRARLLLEQQLVQKNALEAARPSTKGLYSENPPVSGHDIATDAPTATQQVPESTPGITKS